MQWPPVPCPHAGQQTRLDVLESRLVSLRATYAALLQNATTVAANRVSVIDPAVPPLEASSPRVVLNTVLAGILGILLAIGVVYLLEHIDDRMKSAEHVETVTGVPNLGTVLRMPGPVDREPFYRMATLLYPRSPAAEAFRTIRTNIEFASIDKPFRTIVVTSAAPGEGKTVTASNLAVAFAQSGRRTILVDADLRRPGVHDMFSQTNGAGLTDLVHSDTIRVEDVLRPTDNPNLWSSPGIVPPNPAELLGSGRMEVIPRAAPRQRRDHRVRYRAGRCGDRRRDPRREVRRDAARRPALHTTEPPSAAAGRLSPRSTRG
jgi:hypothetical protein